MSVVKIKNKKSLEKLQARLIIRLGRKPTQQEILDFCVLLADQNFERLVELASEVPILNLEKVKKIIEKRNKLMNIDWDLSGQFLSKEDQDIYGN